MRKALIRSTFVLLTLLIAAYAGLAWYFSGMILEPRRRAVNEQHALIANGQLPSPRTFTVTGADDIELNGWYFQQADTADCAVILVHGWGSNRAGMLKYADIFADCGCDLIAYDHRAHGESGGAYGTGGIKEKEDLLRVTDWVVQNTGLDRNRIGWMGASWGAATALLAGAEAPDIAFIVADSPFQDWESAIFERALRMYGSAIEWIKPSVMGLVNWRAGVDYRMASPLLAAEELDVPVFLIHSQNDAETRIRSPMRTARLKPARSSQTVPLRTFFLSGPAENTG